MLILEVASKIAMSYPDMRSLSEKAGHLALKDRVPAGEKSVDERIIPLPACVRRYPAKA